MDASKLITIIDKFAAELPTRGAALTDSQRITAADNICRMIPAFGPSWTGYTGFVMEDGKTTQTMSAEQLGQFLTAKRAFAAANCR